MTDRPILFSGPMLRALLAGTKTQTRRVLSQRGLGACDHREFPEVPEGPWKMDRNGFTCCMTCGNGVTPANNFKGIDLRYVVGDRLYVREAWKTHAAYDDISPAAMGGDEAILYEADGAHQIWGYPAISKIGRFRQGMHMPRWASRLTLTVTEVRVQRLQDISEADAIAEGVEPAIRMCHESFERGSQFYYREGYETLWNSLNEARGFGWAANPWVVAVSFSVKCRNIGEAA